MGLTVLVHVDGDEMDGSVQQQALILQVVHVLVS